VKSRHETPCNEVETKIDTQDIADLRLSIHLRELCDTANRDTRFQTGI
jgi:hypothetical protein